MRGSVQYRIYEYTIYELRCFTPPAPHASGVELGDDRAHRDATGTVRVVDLDAQQDRLGVALRRAALAPWSPASRSRRHRACRARPPRRRSRRTPRKAQFLVECPTTVRKMLPSGAQGARPEHELQPLLVVRSQRTRRASIVNDSLCRLASSSGVAALSDVKSSVTLAVASRGHACTRVSWQPAFVSGGAWRPREREDTRSYRVCLITYSRFLFAVS